MVGSGRGGGSAGGRISSGKPERASEGASGIAESIWGGGSAGGRVSSEKRVETCDIVWSIGREGLGVREVCCCADGGDAALLPSFVGG